MTATAACDDLVTLDYERLYADYQTGLVERLRGFGADAECLSLWVPDEHLETSLRNLLDAAATVGQKAIAVYLGATEVAGLDRDVLLAMAGQFGDARIESSFERTTEGGREGWTLVVRNLHPAEASVVPGRVGTKSRPTRRQASKHPPRLPPRPPAERPGAAEHSEAAEQAQAALPDVYASKIAAIGEQLRHQRTLAPSAEVEHVSVSHADAILELTIDPATHRITQAAFGGSPTARDASILECLCQTIEGLPILEAADHGAIRVEFALRARPSARPVPGIVTPRALRLLFGLPETLIRQALSAYRTSTGYAEHTNDFDAGPGPAWLALDARGREAKLRAVVESVALARGAAATDVQVLAIEHNVRVVLGLQGTLAESDKPRLTVELERAIRDQIDPRLEVYLEEIRDKNKLRRLAIVEG